jgi:hypothetical protein
MLSFSIIILVSITKETLKILLLTKVLVVKSEN